MDKTTKVIINLLREIYPIKLHSVEIAVFALDWYNWKYQGKTPKQTIDARLNEKEHDNIEKLGDNWFRYKPDDKS
ncbi:MAG: hypothetical protein ABIH42_01270, partial [Planctomycetota bacterium]